jgi:hypothetical protein
MMAYITAEVSEFGGNFFRHPTMPFMALKICAACSRLNVMLSTISPATSFPTRPDLRHTLGQ